jgi:signal transduction histidine kinase
MMLEPAQRAGDAHRACEQGAAGVGGTTGDTPAAAPQPPPAPGPDGCPERELWMRRRRLERQLHDGAALRISALTLQIGLFRHRMPAGDAELSAVVDSMQEELHAVLEELREVAGKIYPPLLDDAGLGPALCEVAERRGIAVRVDAGADRFGPAEEGAAYYAVRGCLDALGPEAPEVDVVVRRDGDAMTVEIGGVDVCHAGPMADPVGRLGGTIDVAGGPGAGTITARIPCE